MVNQKTVYGKISVSRDLLDEIEGLIKKNRNLGYASKSQFIAEAIRNHLKVCMAMIKELEKLSA